MRERRGKQVLAERAAAVPNTPISLSPTKQTVKNSYATSINVPRLCIPPQCYPQPPTSISSPCPHVTAYSPQPESSNLHLTNYPSCQIYCLPVGQYMSYSLVGLQTRSCESGECRLA